MILTYNGVHLSEFLDVASHDVSGNDTSNQLDHAVGYATDRIDRNHTVRVELAIVFESEVNLVSPIAFLSSQHTV